MGCVATSETGNVYGQLTVVAQVAGNKQGHARWLCQCSCGNTKEVSGTNLRTGRVKSCGCYRRSGDYCRKHGHASYKRGVSRTYKSWQEMWNRCRVPTHTSYTSYGAKGIRVCERWARFEAFLEDMGERPAGMTIDRKDSKGNYNRDNCKWSTRTEQNRNRSQVIQIEHLGRTQCLAAWCEELGIPYPRTYNRITVQKLSPELAFKKGNK